MSDFQSPEKQNSEKENKLGQSTHQIGGGSLGASMPPPPGNNTAQLQQAANNSDQVQQFKSMQDTANSSPQVAKTAQLKSAANGGVIQRHISYEKKTKQFVIDNTRPGWIGAVGNLKPSSSQERDHIVPFQAIQNEVTLILNGYMNANNTNRPTFVTKLYKFTDALFPSKSGNEYVDMVLHRKEALDAIKNNNKADMHKYARSLLSRLNSSSENVRLGDSSKNRSIGENLDADFNAGTSKHTGTVRVIGGTRKVTNLKVLTLETNSNDIVYRAQNNMGGAMTFVLDAITGKQMSSKDGPTKKKSTGAYPVLVTDPDGVGNPFLFE